MASTLLLSAGTVLFFHSAYSTYEYLSLRKSLDLDPAPLPTDITLEILLAFAVLLLSLALRAGRLREMSWSSEMRKRTIDEIDARPSFANVHHRGQILFAER
ncbi:hypothetical protein OC834_005324 [Tilletia horrida]|uniref:Membrane magnesium transporter n=1 Tax=Tilletia horrida TaxID=155126 RepID=A0AAN6GB23_9BASI|nr:hypothetical protein OC834_005324 [Tilletia horrida]KAK0531357.1 hypothetical protein OC842_003650 [Tilletia horrida]KAK0540308.1 hypothetical protein OC835_000711 [Tilletia horrida]KAK0562080.1 hypothetical protein OC844_002873 [Tilletia horrida]